MGNYYEDSLIKPRIFKRHKLYGFDRKQVLDYYSLFMLIVIIIFF